MVVAPTEGQGESLDVGGSRSDFWRRFFIILDNVLTVGE
jgi:hypothetical protein